MLLLQCTPSKDSDWVFKSMACWSRDL